MIRTFAALSFSALLLSGCLKNGVLSSETIGSRAAFSSEVIKIDSSNCGTGLEDTSYRCVLTVSTSVSASSRSAVAVPSSTPNPSAAPIESSSVIWEEISNDCGWTTFDAQSAVIAGLPIETDVGFCSIVVKASSGEIETKETRIDLIIQNNPPTLTIGDIGPLPQQTYFKTVVSDASSINASDEGFGTYALVAASSIDCGSKVSVHPTNGEIQFNADSNYFGSCHSAIRFTDLSGDSVTEEFEITIAKAPVEPTLTLLTATPTNSTTAIIRVSDFLADDLIKLSTTADCSTVIDTYNAVDGNPFQFQVDGLAHGSHDFWASVSNASGAVCSTTPLNVVIDTVAPLVVASVVDDGIANFDLASHQVKFDRVNDPDVNTYEIVISRVQGSLQANDVIRTESIPQTSFGTDIDFTFLGLALSPGTQYWVGVATMDAVNNISTHTWSDGWTAGQMSFARKLADQVSGFGTDASALGQSIAVSADGNTMVVGAPLDSYNALGMSFLSGAGAAYVYERDIAGNWALEKKLIGFGLNGRVAGDQFGMSVAISGDIIAVGAPNQDYDSSGANSLTSAGAVYLFKYDGLDWQALQKIVASGTNGRKGNDRFGQSVAVEWNRVIVGSPLHDYDQNGTNLMTDAGAVFVYDTGPFYGLQAKLTASGRSSGAKYGFDVAVDQNAFIVGAPGDSTDDGTTDVDGVASQGAAYVYNSATQALIAKLIGAHRNMGSEFGYSVAIQFGQAVVGSPGNSWNGTDSGVVYSFNSANWLANHVDSGSAGDRLGHSVALSSGALAASAPLGDYPGGPVNDTGYVRVYRQNGLNFDYAQTVFAQGSGAVNNTDDGFGIGLAISFDMTNGKVRYTLGVGAPGYDFGEDGTTSSISNGAVFLYQ